MSEILSIRDMTVRYHDGVEALRGVCLSLWPHQRVGLIGPNGAGKTSLLLAIMRGVPFEGDIEIDGVALTRRTAERARSRCGMVFQEADDQLFMPTLLADVAFGPLNQGLGSDEAESHARAAIAAVGLAGLDDRSGHHLSGGQKRNAALATVLAMRASLLLLDEPGANLDFRSRGRLMELLAGRDEAMLIATHDLDMVRQLCTRVVLLDNGQVAADGSTDEILGDTALLSRHDLA